MFELTLKSVLNLSFLFECQCKSSLYKLYHFIIKQIKYRYTFFFMKLFIFLLCFYNPILDKTLRYVSQNGEIYQNIPLVFFEN